MYQSVQSGVGKLSCKRGTSTETLWNRKAPSLSSPEDEEIFLPKLPKSWHADVFKDPKVSTAIGPHANVGIIIIITAKGNADRHFINTAELSRHFISS